MAINTERGFTIIEVILFLTISGLLFAALLIGVSSSISGQRYIDSVRSVKALFEDQYSAAVNLQNAANNGCGVVSVGRGQSQDCIILGRLVHIQSGGKSVQVSNVIAKEKSSPSPYESNISDDDSFNRTMPMQWILGSDTRNISLEWDSTLTNVGGSISGDEYIYILRSPVSGLMRVYIQSTHPINSLVPSSNPALKKCIMNDSGNQPKQLITIDPSSTNANFIKTEEASRTDCP